ncbi:MAG: signal peptidase I [Anaerolineae bacterium]|nr:signal peptidase I [Anaerolineae bacterium]
MVALARPLIEVLETVAPAFVIALLINLFLAQSTYVYGHSMEPNLHTDQRLVVEKVSYRLHAPQRGDIVVVSVPNSEIPLIKRVIGLPGEVIAIQDNHVTIDGVPLDEAYLDDVVQRDYGPHEVPAGHVFVMGDNRGASNDSRYFGPVREDQIIGRAWFSYWPLGEMQFFR